MVVLTIVSQKNGQSVYFDEPIPQVHFMRLVSCSLYNSWHNLNRVGQISLTQASETLASIPGGHYTLHGLVKELKSNLEQNKNKAGIKYETNNPNSLVEITSEKRVLITHGLAALLGTGTILDLTSHVRKLNTPSAYFIHCDLIDRTKTFFNGNRSEVFAKFDIRGLPYDKVSYYSLPQEALRECSTSQHANRITLSVKDESGELFDFNGLPLEFVLELN